MKLHIVLEEKYAKNLNIAENDIILSKKEYACLCDSGAVYIQDFAIDDNIAFCLAREVAEVFEKHGKRLKKHVNNSFTHTIRPLFQLFNAIDTIISENPVNEIVLYGGRTDVEFVPYYLAEGEAEKSFMYETSFYFNYFVVLKYKNMIHVVLEKPDSWFRLQRMIFFRRWGLQIYKLFYLMIFHFKLAHMTKSVRFDTGNEKKLIVFPVRNIAQFSAVDNIYGLLERSSEFVPVLFLYERLNVRGNPVLDYAMSKNYRIVQIYKTKSSALFMLPLAVFIRSAANAVFSFSSEVCLGLIKERELFREAVLLDFEKDIYKQLLSRKLKEYASNIAFVFSVEIKSPEAFAENYAAAENGIRSCNCQSQSIVQAPLPFFDMGGEFFLFENLHDYGYFTQFPYPEKDKMKFIGTFKYFDALKSDYKSVPENKILYLTQPYEYANQFEQLNILKNSLNGEMTLHIKKHPRDTNSYADLINGTTVFLEDEKDIRHIMASYEIFVSRTTTMILDAIMYKKKVIACITTSFERNRKPVYINGRYMHVCYSNSELADIRNIIDHYDIFKNFSNLRTDFYNTDFEENIREVLLGNR